MDGYRSAPYLAVFYADICTGGLGASSASLFPIAGLSAEVIQLPDITANDGVFQGTFKGELSPHPITRQERHLHEII